MRIKKVKLKLLYVFLALLLLVTVINGGRATLPAFAETTQYTSVVEDLKKDSNFNANDYPEDSKDTSIYVIQIAESTSGELFVYTYQPCNKTTPLVATEINMSLTEDLSVKVPEKTTGEGIGAALNGMMQGIFDAVQSALENATKLYDLTLVSKVGVFCKYVVNDFTVSSDDVRYYNITSIYREWIKGVDEETGNDNDINEVAFKVGKCYKATTENNIVKFECSLKEVVTVTDKYVDFLRYTEGFWLWRDSCDSHYVAFSTDWEIDYLYDAQVSYVTRSVSYFKKIWTSDQYKYGDPQTSTVTLSELDSGHTSVTGLGGVRHSWSRIQSVSEFVDSENLSSDVKEQLKNKQWVLRFAETDYTHYPNMNGYSSYNDVYTEVSEVTILRLKFKKDGDVYNLGVVDNMQSGDDIPGNPQLRDDESFGFWQYIWNCIVKLFKGEASFIEKIVAIVAIFVALFILPLALLILSIFIPPLRPFVKAMFNGIWWVIKNVFIGLWYIVTAPFRFIVWLIKKIRGD